MKTRFHISAIIIIATGFLYSVTTQAQNMVPPPRNFSPDRSVEHAQSYERVIIRKFDVRSNPTVRVDGSFGPVSITGATSNTVEVTISIKVEESLREEAK